MTGVLISQGYYGILPVLSTPIQNSMLHHSYRCCQLLFKIQCFKQLFKITLSPLLAAGTGCNNTENMNSKKRSSFNLYSQSPLRVKKTNTSTPAAEVPSVTELSKVINPSSSSRNHGKCIRQSTDVLQSVNSTILNFDEVSEDQNNSGSPYSGVISEDDTISQFCIEMNTVAESQECVTFGEPSFKCKYCMASLWYEERSVKAKRVKDIEFSICYMRGIVQLPFLKKTSALAYFLNDWSGSKKQSF